MSTGQRGQVRGCPDRFARPDLSFHDVSITRMAVAENVKGATTLPTTWHGGRAT